MAIKKSIHYLEDFDNKVFGVSVVVGQRMSPQADKKGLSKGNWQYLLRCSCGAERWWNCYEIKRQARRGSAFQCLFCVREDMLQKSLDQVREGRRAYIASGCQVMLADQFRKDSLFRFAWMRPKP